MFLHHFGGSSRAWSEVINQLGDDYHCVAPDLRGFGDSDAPAANYSIKDYADDVAGLVEVLKLKRYVLIGHSMGGKIALYYAAQKPSGLELLVLLAPSPPVPEPMDEAERRRLLTTTATEMTPNKLSATSPLALYLLPSSSALLMTIYAVLVWRGARGLTTAAAKIF